MNKKLTLNVDESLIEFAHLYSKQSKQSISGLFERYLTRLKNEIKIDGISNDAKELYGILDKGDIPDKRELRRDFYEKGIN